MATIVKFEKSSLQVYTFYHKMSQLDDNSYIQYCTYVSKVTFIYHSSIIIDNEDYSS